MGFAKARNFERAPEPLADLTIDNQRSAEPAESVLKYNLRRYNRRRHELLLKIKNPPVKKVKEKSLQQSITDAMRVRTHWLTGNINVSLFWEEKIFILVRSFQLYAFFFFTYYEYWPTAARTNLTWLFAAGIGTWNILSQDQYYEQITDARSLRDNTFYFLAALVALLLSALFLIFCYKLRFRLENVYMSICWYKWLFWLCELAMVPLMFNIAWLANCKFYTLRDALVLANCAEDGNHWPNIMIVAMALGFVAVFAYNCVLLYIVLSSLISIERHEHHIRKKEVESVLRISTMWRT